MDYRHDKPFRLIQSWSIDGGLALAMSRTLSTAMRTDHTTAPVVMLHNFDAPIVSVGGGKRAIYDHLLINKMASEGVQLIARQSSGTAVLSSPDTDLQFTVLTHPRHWDNYSIKGMFLHINRTLSAALQEIGVETMIAEKAKHGPMYNCFASIDPMEVVAGDGRKLVGSGLFARANCYLQEGVIPITPEYRSVDRFIDGSFEYDDPPTSITEEIGRDYDIKELAAVVAGHFYDRWPIELDDFTTDEVAAARKLRDTQFGNKARKWLA